MKTQILPPTSANITLAAAVIKRGGIVAFPTETVYGLGANALDEPAAKKIYEVKGRPADNPLIVHLSCKNDIETVTYPDKRAEKLIEKFMPGALTIILKKKEIVPSSITGGLDTVAVRIPDNPVALALIKESGVPLAAPSANTSTTPSPTSAIHVYNDLCGKLEYILDGGSCKVGIESTIVDLSGETARLLRKGGIPYGHIMDVIGEIEVVEKSALALCPGMKYRHYAPRARVILIESGERIPKIDGKVKIITLNDFKDVDEYAQKLYYELRRADEESFDVIVCEKAPAVGIGESINNRLEKASHG